MGAVAVGVGVGVGGIIVGVAVGGTTLGVGVGGVGVGVGPPQLPLAAVKIAGVITPLTVAVTVKLPTKLLVIKPGTLTCPYSPVATVMLMLLEPEKTPLGPVEGAVKVTGIPISGLL